MKKPNSINQPVYTIAQFTERAIPLARPSGAAEAQISRPSENEDGSVPPESTERRPPIQTPDPPSAETELPKQDPS